SPTSSVMSTVACWLTPTVTPDRTNFLNPASVVSILYLPGMRNGTAYAPSFSDSASDATSVASLVTTTVTGGIAALWGSVTRPRMVPRNSCAFAAEASSTPTVTSNAIRVAPLIGTETIRYRRAISKNLIQPMRTSVNLGRDELRDSRGDARG